MTTNNARRFSNALMALNLVCLGAVIVVGEHSNRVTREVLDLAMNEARAAKAACSVDGQQPPARELRAVISDVQAAVAALDREIQESRH